MKNINVPADETRIWEALEEMKAKRGEDFSLDSVNLAELNGAPVFRGPNCGT